MTLLYSDPVFLRHETGGHVERAERIRRLPDRFRQASLDQRVRHVEWEPISLRRLRQVHSGGYVDEVWAFAKSGGGYIEHDTVVSPSSYDVALMAAGSVCDATERIARGEDRQALCLVRPPGQIQDGVDLQPGYDVMRETSTQLCVSSTLPGYIELSVLASDHQENPSTSPLPGGVSSPSMRIPRSRPGASQILSSPSRLP